MALKERKIYPKWKAIARGGRLYFDRELNTNEYKKVQAAKTREELRKKLRDKRNQTKNMMTQQQYMKKMKSEKKC